MSRPRRVVIVPSRDVPRSPWWLLGLCMVPCIVGFGAAIARLPWTQDHTGLILASIILSGFLWWLLSSVLTGYYRSNQGNYDRRSAPPRYWIHVAILFGGNVLLGYAWVTYFLLTLK